MIPGLGRAEEEEVEETVEGLEGLGRDVVGFDADA